MVNLIYMQAPYEFEIAMCCITSGIFVVLSFQRVYYTDQKKN